MAISDAKLARLASKREELRQQIADLESDKKVLDQKIIAELERRGTKAVEHGGVRVSIVVQSTTSYAVDAARTTLPASVFKKVIKTSIDPALLSQQVQAGRVRPEQLAEISTVHYKSPYVSVGRASE